jgi:hypothetical protein
MKISMADHGHYYRGLLILIRKDRTISDEERVLMMRIGKVLGFEESFCAQAIRDILENEYIGEDPPRFADPDVARCFLRDGIRLADADSHIDASELTWLKAVAAANGLDDAWLEHTVSEMSMQPRNGSETTLEAAHLRWR